jgi:hypothetical protein
MEAYSGGTRLDADVAAEAASEKEGRTQALLLERYLARSLNEQRERGDADAETVLRSIQSLLSFCLNEFAVQCSGRCEARGRLVKKLAEGSERCFVHAMDLLAQDRENARDDEREVGRGHKDEMELVKSAVFSERESVAKEKKTLLRENTTLGTELEQTQAALEQARQKVSR